MALLIGIFMACLSWSIRATQYRLLSLGEVAGRSWYELVRQSLQNRLMQSRRQRQIKGWLPSIITLAVIVSACSAEGARVRASDDVQNNSASNVTIERILSLPLTKG